VTQAGFRSPNWLRYQGSDRIPQMLITTGQVYQGAIEVEGSSLPEGTMVTILVPEDDGTFELTAEDESRILAAIAEAEKDGSLEANQVLDELKQL
jgi:hypothetical protein